MRAHRFGLPAALAVAVVLAGCGLSDPYTSQHTVSNTTPTPTSGTSTGARTATNADPAPERGGTIPGPAQAAQNRLPAGAGSATPQAALERYANLYVNWTGASVGRVQEKLAAISVGQARAQALQAAAAYGHDSALQRSQVANTGTVIAIASGQGPDAGSWVIVTRESTTGTGDYAGLPPTDHVTDAQVEHISSGWIVSSWSPQR